MLPSLLLALQAQPANPHLLLIGIDGLRPDALEAAETPNLDRLIAEGAYSAEAQAGPITVSGPGWTQVTSGVWGDRHGVTDNAFGGHRIDEYPDFFTFVEQQHPEYDTRALLSWKPLETFVVKGADRIEFQDYEKGGDQINTAKAVEWMADSSLDALYLYMADVDVAGHAHGFSPEVPEYVAEIEEVDTQLGEVLDAMRARPDFEAERWLVVMTSDHGGIGTGHAGGEPPQRTIPYLVSGAGAHRGPLVTVPNQVDVAVTCLWHLGIEIDPEWRLDGRPLGLRFSAPLGQNLIFNWNAEYSPGASLGGPDRGVPGWRDIGGMTIPAYETYPALNPARDPDTLSRGNNLFVAGGTGATRASQAIDLAAHAELIDRSALEFGAFGYLGSTGPGVAPMECTFDFLDERGGLLESWPLEPVKAPSASAVQEAGLLRTHIRSGSVPRGARSVLVALSSKGPTEEGAASCADNLYLALRHPGGPRASFGIRRPQNVAPGTVFAPGPASSDRPNILLFMADDLGWRDHSLDYGLGPEVPQTHFRTPHLEHLAAEGTVYTNAYAAAPVCTPSRVAWMTGRSPARSHITYWVFDADRDTSAAHPTLTAPPWRTEGMQPSDPSLPRYLSEAGYRTIHVGKAHFGATGSPGEDPLNLGFDVNIAGHGRGAPGSYLGTDHFQGSRRQGKEGPGAWDVPGLEQYHGQDIFLTEALALEATREIRAATAAGEPFFMNFAPYAVHTPIMANAQYLENYTDLDEREAAYATMVESVDASLGALLEVLEAEGVLDNTLIVYTSDNGGLSALARGGEPNVHNAPLRSGKGSAYEGGIRVPLVVRWPGHAEPGAVSSKPVISHDLFPTFLLASGLPPDGVKGMHDDGQDIFEPMSTFQGLDIGYPPLLWHMPHQWGAKGPGIRPFSAYRLGHQKIIYWHDDQHLEVYSLGNLPLEDQSQSLWSVTGTSVFVQFERALIDAGAQTSILKETGEPIPGVLEAFRRQRGEEGPPPRER